MKPYFLDIILAILAAAGVFLAIHTGIEAWDSAHVAPPEIQARPTPAAPVALEIQI